MAWSPHGRQEFSDSQRWRGPVVMGTPNTETRKQLTPSLNLTAALWWWLGTAPLPGSNTGQVHGKERAGLLLHSSTKQSRFAFKAQCISSWSPVTSSYTQGKNLWSKMNFCCALLMLFVLAELHSPYFNTPAWRVFTTMSQKTSNTWQLVRN